MAVICLAKVIPRATRNVVFALAVARGFASTALVVASLAADVGLTALAVDFFEVDLEAEELLIRDFLVTAIGISPRKWIFLNCYVNP